jgi:hypothetical protein
VAVVMETDANANSKPGTGRLRKSEVGKMKARLTNCTVGWRTSPWRSWPRTSLG